MKSIVIFIILSVSFILNASTEYFPSGGKNFVKMKGLIRISWEESEEEGCGKLYGLEFKSENPMDFGGETLILHMTEINYYKDWEASIFEKDNMEIEKTLKNLYPNEKIWTTKKGKLEKPVAITLNLDNIRAYTECDHTTFYSKVEKIEAIDRTSAKIGNSEDTSNRSIYYNIYSKDGYANVRKNPDKNSPIVTKLENGADYLHMAFSIGDWLYFYKGVYDEEGKSYAGFIHKSQVEPMYVTFTVDSKEGYTNVRERPDIKSRILKTLKNGKKVEKIGSKGEWIEVYGEWAESKTGKDNNSSKLSYGYIHRSQLKEIK